MTTAETKEFFRRGNILYVRVQVGDEELVAPLIVAEAITKDGVVYSIEALDKMVEDWHASRYDPRFAMIEENLVDPDGLEYMRAVHEKMVQCINNAMGVPAEYIYGNPRELNDVANEASDKKEKK